MFFIFFSLLKSGKKLVKQSLSHFCHYKSDGKHPATAFICYIKSHLYFIFIAFKVQCSSCDVPPPFRRNALAGHNALRGWRKHMPYHLKNPFCVTQKTIRVTEFHLFCRTTLKECLIQLHKIL